MFYQPSFFRMCSRSEIYWVQTACNKMSKLSKNVIILIQKHVCAFSIFSLVFECGCSLAKSLHHVLRRGYRYTDDWWLSISKLGIISTVYSIQVKVSLHTIFFLILASSCWQTFSFWNATMFHLFSIYKSICSNQWANCSSQQN